MSRSIDQLDTGALEIQYIEEYFGEFPRKKTAQEIMNRLRDREYLILMAEAPLPDDPGLVVPVSYKIVHELREREAEPKLTDLVTRLKNAVRFEDRKVLYSWIGGTRRDWRGQGHFRALTEESEAWAHASGYHEVVAEGVTGVRSGGLDLVRAENVEGDCLRGTLLRS